MSKFRELADIIFPDVTQSLSELQARYPKRDLWEGAEVTRFAPSPTGFLHTGSLFTAMVANLVAERSKGIFFLRIEDTDTKREVENSDSELVRQLMQFGIEPKEGFKGHHDFGLYGPYRQSERAGIYRTVIKHMVENNLAYPCFATVEELDELRRVQEIAGVVPGYYGKFAKYRDLAPEDAVSLIREGKPYVMRFRSPGDKSRYFETHDIIRGELSMPENDQDIVILKSDGLPTYHFAHVVDDHLMGTTIVSRGEEWLSSLPIHIQMFEALGWKAPKYAHLPTIMKMEGESRRKLSKRKDTEASVSFFSEKGYPLESLIEYLMTIANSNYEDWRRNNPTLDYKEFPFELSRMASDGAIFDLVKIDSISREVISRLSVDDVVANSLEYGDEFNENFSNLIRSNEEYFRKIISIERFKENPRKDFANYSDIASKIGVFYQDGYNRASVGIEDMFNKDIAKGIVAASLQAIRPVIWPADKQESEWLDSIKEKAEVMGFSRSVKDFKKDPDKYIGHIGDFIELVRVSVFCAKQSPNIYEVIKVLGEEETTRRLDNATRALGF